MSGAQRYSSTPQIEEPTIVLPQPSSAQHVPSAETKDSKDYLSSNVPHRPEMRSSGSGSLFAHDRSSHSPSSGDNSSNSEDWYRFSHATMSSRMSGIIRGFPSPPDATPPPAASILGSYFPDDAPFPSPLVPPGRIPRTPEPDTESERRRERS